ncbi:MAG: RND transporter, partial [Akkermansiaceae bacterium]|nr:RND transporter [Akkermansiaceae bacterium]
VDEQRVNVIADLEDGPGEGEILGDAFRVEARVVIWESEDALLLPAGALFRSGEEWAVYRVVGAQAELATIEVGRNNGN